jgi:hypothetical protein
MSQKGGMAKQLLKMIKQYNKKAIVSLVSGVGDCFTQNRYSNRKTATTIQIVLVLQREVAYAKRFFAIGHRNVLDICCSKNTIENSYELHGPKQK